MNDVINRVAKYVSEVECKYNGRPYADTLMNMFIDDMKNNLWLPSSPILMNAGTDHPMLSACFVLDIKDDMASIFNTLRDASLIQQHGGGVGFNFSNIREKGATVWSTNGVASGVVSFMQVFNAATNIVKQGGRRRGACIAVLDVDHPDIMEFIHCKDNDGEMNSFNISVRVTDDFMKKAEIGETYPLISRSNGSECGRLNARDVLLEIARQAIKTGDPGILFGDEIERHNPTPELGRLTGVNPCGEVSLYDKEACNLASINLEKFDSSGYNKENDVYIDDAVECMVHFLDDSIDVNVFPIPEIEETVKATRKIGIGITGLHGFLINSGLKYDSEEGRNKAQWIMRIISSAAIRTSSRLGFARGSYPKYSGHGTMRNATRTCIAPTGTISILMDTSSSGIEPVFNWAYTRKVEGIDYMVVPPILDKLLDKYAVTMDKETVYRKIEANGGSLQGLTFLPEEMRELCRTAYEISPIDHINMLAAIQTEVDNNISKTINIGFEDFNCDNDSNVQYVYDLIMTAYSRGCRGITIYVDGAKKNQVLTAHNTCPICGSVITVTEGCKKCPNCGWSTCSL